MQPVYSIAPKNSDFREKQAISKNSRKTKIDISEGNKFLCKKSYAVSIMQRSFAQELSLRFVKLAREKSKVL